VRRPSGVHLAGCGRSSISAFAPIVIVTAESTISSIHGESAVRTASRSAARIHLTACATAENGDAAKNGSNRGGNAQLDLDTASDHAPECKLRADLFAAFTHAWHAAGAALFYQCWFNALAVIPNAQAEVMFSVRKFCFHHRWSRKRRIAKPVDEGPA
jgi:hypothetical protein